MTTRVPLVYVRRTHLLSITLADASCLFQGSGLIGVSEEKGFTKIHTLEEAQAAIDIFVGHGHKEIDTSRVYGSGTTEEVRAFKSMFCASLIRISVLGKDRSERCIGGHQVRHIIVNSSSCRN